MKATTSLICLLSFAAHYDVAAQRKLVGNFSKELFDLEIAFSNESRERGFRLANLHYAADNAIVFRPYEMNAKEWSNRVKGQDSAYRVTWYPSVVVSSKAGDLGYCTGPFENVSTSPGDNRVFNKGQFFTVWSRQRDGTMRFVIDFGSGTLDPSEYVTPEPIFVLPSKIEDTKKFGGAGWNEILSLEQKYGLECQSGGDMLALEKFASEDICFFYHAKFYARGMSAVRKRLENQVEHHSWLPVSGMISESGDLAYVYGSHWFFKSPVDEARTGYYLRIWKRVSENQWVITAQVRSLLPDSKK